MSISRRKNANQSAHGVVLQGETQLFTGAEGELSLIMTGAGLNNFYFFFVQRRKTKSTFGYNLLVILNALCGQLLDVHPANRANKCWRVLVLLIELFMTSLGVFCFATAGYTIFSKRNEFKFAIFVAAGFLGVVECLFRLVYTLVRRRRIENLFERMQVALNYSISGIDKQPFVRKISRCFSNS